MSELLDTISGLRRKGDFQGARRLGEQAYAAGEDSPELIRVLIDIYLDIEAECIRTGVTSFIAEIDRRVDELLAECSDDGRLTARRRAIKLTALPGYERMEVFDRLSMCAGREREAYEGVRAYMAANPVNPRFHETAALILYRYLRASYSSMESTAARRLLADYMSLAVPRPSRVHSLMLRMAVRVARRFPDFNFARFFHQWDPRMLRPDDMPGLAVAALACVIDSPRAADFAPLLELVPASADDKSAILRESFRYLTAAAIRQGDMRGAIDLLNLYSLHSSMHAASASHSAMLAFALRVMTGDAEHHFPAFFVNWDPFFLRLDDYRPTQLSGGDSVPSLASRAMGRCFAAIKNDLPRHAYILPRVIRAFDSMAPELPDGPDELFERRKALMLAWTDCEDSAIDRFCALARRDDARSARFWLDFAEVLSTYQQKMGVIALGIIRTVPGDDNDAAELRLALAQLLHFAGSDSMAALELRIYRDAVDSIAAEPSARYGAIARTIDTSVVPTASNDLLYHTLASEALEIIYSRYPRRSMSVIEIVGDRLLLSDGPGKPVELSLSAWPIVARLRPGDNVAVRFDKSDHAVAVIPIDDSPYAYLPLYYGVVTSTSPLMVHCAGKPDAIEADARDILQPGATVTMRVYRDITGGRRGLETREVPVAEARTHFDRLCVAIYDYTDGNALYSAGPDSEPGELVGMGVVLPALYTPLDIYFYKTRDGKRHVISVADAAHPEECRGIKDVSGPLRYQPDGAGTVRDVTVAPELVSGREIAEGTFVTATAVYIPRTASSTPVWRAVSVSPYQ